jgi:phosphatidylglycerol:prolipoprotein diacylglycerol transferase
MALTAVAVLVYLRVKRLPLLAVMDAWAPCGAVLGAALCLGHFVEGTDLGMPWGFGGRLLPVQVIGAVLALGLAWLLFRILGGERSAGRVAGSGLLDAGIVCFFLDMIEQPSGLAGNAWLDPSQWIALGSLIVGWVVLHTHPNPPLSREKAALILEHFVLGGGGPHDHEELEYTNSTDPLVLEASRRFVDVQSEFPVGPGEPGYCNEQGKEVLLDYARRLRGDSASLEKERV